MFTARRCLHNNYLIYLYDIGALIDSSQRNISQSHLNFFYHISNIKIQLINDKIKNEIFFCSYNYSIKL